MDMSNSQSGSPPAARPDVVREDNAGRLRTRLVLEGANIPLTAAAEKLLAARGVTVMPDIIANTEAVLTAAKSRGVLPREAALELPEHRVRDAMRYRRFAIL